MFFEIIHERPDVGWDHENVYVDSYTWRYRQGSPVNPGDVLALAPRQPTRHGGFDTERECRSNIAVARKAFVAARLAKVVTA